LGTGRSKSDLAPDLGKPLSSHPFAAHNERVQPKPDSTLAQAVRILKNKAWHRRFAPWKTLADVGRRDSARHHPSVPYSAHVEKGRGSPLAPSPRPELLALALALYRVPHVPHSGRLHRLISVNEKNRSLPPAHPGCTPPPERCCLTEFRRPSAYDAPYTECDSDCAPSLAGRHAHLRLDVKIPREMLSFIFCDGSSGDTGHLVHTRLPGVNMWRGTLRLTRPAVQVQPAQCPALLTWPYATSNILPTASSPTPASDLPTRFRIEDYLLGR